MTAFINSPFQNPILVQKGVPVYLFGSYNFRQDNTKMLINKVALTGNVATITGVIVVGEIPAVGSLISIAQTTNTSGFFNVNRVAITAATIDNTGAGIITFPLVHADIGAANDTGTAIIEVPEVGETIANGASIACCFQAPEGDSQFTVPVSVTFPTVPTTLSVKLQGAIHNIDSEYTQVGTTDVATVATSAQTVGPFTQFTLQRGYFYRLIVSTLAGNGKIVAKIGG